MMGNGVTPSHHPWDDESSTQPFKPCVNMYQHGKTSGHTTLTHETWFGKAERLNSGIDTEYDLQV